MTDRKGASAPGFQYDPFESLGDLINDQAKDHRLWPIPKTDLEALLQYELKRLHGAAELLVETYKQWKRESGDG